MRQSWVRIFKKGFIAFAIIVVTVLFLRIISAAAAAAKTIPCAVCTFSGKFFGTFHKAKAVPLVIQLLNGVCFQIPQTILVNGIEVAREYAAVRFYQILDITMSCHGAAFGGNTVHDAQKIVKVTNGNNKTLCEILIPQIEQFFQKVGVCLRSKGVSVAAALLFHWVHAGNVLLIQPVVSFVEIVYFRDVLRQL